MDIFSGLCVTTLKSLISKCLIVDDFGYRKWTTYDKLKLISEIHFILLTETLQNRFFILRVVSGQIYNGIKRKVMCHIDNLTFKTSCLITTCIESMWFKNVMFVIFFFKTIFSKCAFWNVLNTKYLGRFYEN